MERLAAKLQANSFGGDMARQMGDTGFRSPIFIIRPSVMTIAV